MKQNNDDNGVNSNTEPKKISAENDGKKKDSDDNDKQEIEPSDRLASVQDRFEKAASNTPPSMFDKQNTDPAKADDQADAARTFLTDYKKDVVTGARLKEDIETNIANASKAVTNVYGR